MDMDMDMDMIGIILLIILMICVLTWSIIFSWLIRKIDDIEDKIMFFEKITQHEIEMYHKMEIVIERYERLMREDNSE